MSSSDESSQHPPYTQYMEPDIKNVSSDNGGTNKMGDTAETKFWNKLKEDEFRIRNKGIEEFFELRKDWSGVIKRWITTLILFNVGLTVTVGLGWLNYQTDKWFIRLIVGETFLQIVGLGYIAVRFLFSENHTNKPIIKK